MALGKSTSLIIQVCFLLLKFSDSAKNHANHGNINILHGEMWTSKLSGEVIEQWDNFFASRSAWAGTFYRGFPDFGIPSGKRLHSYGQSTHFLWENPLMAIFNSYVKLPEGNFLLHHSSLMEHILSGVEDDF